MHGVHLSVRDDALILTGPVSCLPEALIAQIRACKAEILQFQRAAADGRMLTELLPGPATGPMVGSYPASFGQARLAFLNTVQPRSPAYNVAASLIIRGECDVGALRRALTWLVRHHRALRTSLEIRDGRIFGKVAPDVTFDLSVLDLSTAPPEEAARRVGELRRLTASTRFELAEVPLWRCRLVRACPRELELIVVIHHFIADGWSLARALRELASVYADFIGDREPPAPPPRAEYSDYAAWQERAFQSSRGRAAIDWWRETLAAFDSPIGFPTNRPRPTVLSDRGDRVVFGLDTDTTTALRRFAAQRGATVSAVISAVHAALLYRYSRSERFLVGLAVSNRPQDLFHEVFGFFVNWLPVPADFSERPTFETFFGRWQRARLAALDHQDTPFDAIARVLPRVPDLSRHPLFQHMVVSHVPARRIRFGDLSVSIEPLSTQTAKLDITLFLTDSAGAVPIEGCGEMALEVEYSTDLFERRTVEAITEAFVALLRSAITRPHAQLGSLDMLSPSGHERARSLASGGSSLCISSPLALWTERAACQPNAPAVIHDGLVVSYGALAARAAAIASALRAVGVVKGDRVALLLPRGPDFIASFLAVMTCGASFLPLDAVVPAERLAAMVDDAQPRVVLTSASLESSAHRAAHGPRLLRLETIPASEKASGGRPAEQCQGTDAAYLLYTSGSTGRPKGVIGAHGPLANFCVWLNSYLGCRETDRVLCKTPHGFDASLRETLAPLCAGATLVLAGDNQAIDPQVLARMITCEAITILHATPTVYREILADIPGGSACRTPTNDSLRHVMCGGEVLDGVLVAAHFAAHATARLHNVYGPTECTIDVTVHEVRPGEQSVPLGRPISGAIVYVAGPDLSPVPPGAVGEIVVGGVPPGPGYWRRPTEQRARFVRPARGPFAFERVYRTGDLGRYSADGLLLFEGRSDRQVKVRGARVELGEIEHAMLLHPGVVAAVVAVCPVADEAEALLGFIQFGAAVADPIAEVDRVRRELATRLPRYMQPVNIVPLDRIPRLPSGKVSAAATAALWRPSDTPRPITVLGGDEKLVADLMGELLAREITSSTTDFFCAGGHSLTAVRLIVRLARRSGVAITVNELFENPTVAELAAVIGRKRAAAGGLFLSPDSITPAVRPRAPNA